MTIDKTHVIFDVRSDLRSSGTNDKPVFNPIKNIDFEKFRDKQYFMRLQNIQLPVSFYQINSNNNVLSITERNSGDITVQDITITMPEGNYTIDEFATELQIQLNAETLQSNAYVVAYDIQLSKIYISYSGGASVNVDFNSFNDGSTLAPILGVGQYNSDDTITIAVSTSTFMPYTYNMAPTSYVSLTSNISSHNHLSVQRQELVAARLFITDVRGSYINETNNTGYLVRISQNSISSIGFIIRDPYNNEISLNGIPWSCQIVFYEKED